MRRSEFLKPMSAGNGDASKNAAGTKYGRLAGARNKMIGPRAQCHMLRRARLVDACEAKNLRIVFIPGNRGLSLILTIAVLPRLAHVLMAGLGQLYRY